MEEQQATRSDEQQPCQSWAVSAMAVLLVAFEDLWSVSGVSGGCPCEERCVPIRRVIDAAQEALGRDVLPILVHGPRSRRDERTKRQLRAIGGPIGRRLSVIDPWLGGPTPIGAVDGQRESAAIITRLLDRISGWQSAGCRRYGPLAVLSDSGAVIERVRGMAVSGTLPGDRCLGLTIGGRGNAANWRQLSQTLPQSVGYLDLASLRMFGHPREEPARFAIAGS